MRAKSARLELQSHNAKSALKNVGTEVLWMAGEARFVLTRVMRIGICCDGRGEGFHESGISLSVCSNLAGGGRGQPELREVR